MSHGGGSVDRSGGGGGGSGNGSRSWFEGTMEVISAGIAPRSVTPLPFPTSPSGHSAGARQVFSAPNSPARNGTYSNFFPSINRLPSQDSLDRSIHNESGNGKSSAQVIRDLRQSNAAFSAKTASLEAKFMNELNEVTRSFEDKNHRLEEALKVKDNEVATLEARCNTSEYHIREKETLLVKIREESAYQRHTISDLKNQLFQLNNEIQEGEHTGNHQNNEGSNNTWKIENKNLTLEIESLRAKVKEGTKHKGQLMVMTKELEDLRERDQKSREIDAETFDTMQLEKTREALHRSTSELQMTESALSELQGENTRAMDDHGKMVEGFKQELVTVESTWKTKEDSLLKEIKSLQSEDSQIVADLRTELKEKNKALMTMKSDGNSVNNIVGGEATTVQLSELKKQLFHAVADVGKQKELLAARNEEISEVNKELIKIKSDADNTELYRRDEAEDLRVLHDAQEDEIGRLRKELEEASNELELREQELAETELTNRTENKNNNGLNIDHQSQVEKSRSKITSLEKDSIESKNNYEEEIKRLEVMVQQLTSEINKNNYLQNKVTEYRAIPIVEAVSYESSPHDEKGSSIDVGKLNQRLAEEQEEKNIAIKDVEEMSVSLNNIRKLRESELKEYEIVRNRLDEAENLVATTGDEIVRYCSQIVQLEVEQKKLNSRKNDILERNTMLQERVSTLQTNEESFAVCERLQIDQEKKIRTLKENMLKTEESLRSQLEKKDAEILNLVNRHALSASTGQSTSDSVLAEKLSEEASFLRQQLQKKNDSNSHQSGGSLESDLRKDLHTLRQAEEKMKTELRSLKREKDIQFKEMKGKLDDRDTTISALVKSNMAIEARLSAMKKGRERGYHQDETFHSSNMASASANSINGNEDEINELQCALADYRKVKEILSSEVSLLKKELKFAETEIHRLNEAVDEDGSSCASYHFRRQIQERDDAVSALVQQSMSQERHTQEIQDRLLSMTKQLELTRTEKRKSSGPLREELRRLQQESEIFAGQIIEQDEELEALRESVNSRDDKIMQLERNIQLMGLETEEMNTAKDALQRNNIKDKVNELMQDNEEKSVEIILLQTRLEGVTETAMKKDLAKTKDEVIVYQEKYEKAQRDLSAAISALKKERRSRDNEESKLRDELETMMQRKSDEMEDQIRSKEKEIDDLLRDVDESKANKESLKSEVMSLQVELAQKEDAAKEAQSAVQELERMLQNESQNRDELEKMLQNESQDRNVVIPSRDEEVEAKTVEVEDLKQAIRALENELQIVTDLNESNGIEDPRQVSAIYEEKMTILAGEKDVAIAKVKTELIDLKRQAKGDFEELEAELQNFENENHGLRQEIESIVHEKNSDIVLLEQTLQAQEQLVSSMRSEMDHMQGSMRSNILTRREDLEEMQREMMDLTSKATTQERDIMDLKMELEESKLDHMTESVKLRDTIASLESEVQVGRQSTTIPSDTRIGEVMARLEKLRWRNASIQEENIKLKTRLVKAEDEIKATKNEKYRTASLEAKVGLLTKQLREAEGQKKNQKKLMAKPPAFPQKSVNNQSQSSITGPLKLPSILETKGGGTKSTPGSPSSSSVSTKKVSNKTPTSPSTTKRAQSSPLKGFPKLQNSPLRGLLRGGDSPLKSRRPQESPSRGSSSSKVPDSPSRRFRWGKKSKETKQEISVPLNDDNLHQTSSS